MSLIAAGAIVLTTAVGAVAQPAVMPASIAEASRDGLVAEYLFDNTTGSEVENSAEGSTLGSATVHNAADSQWTGTSLTLTGGAKNSSGNWVELPEDILSGATSATVVAEVKPDPTMLTEFHFLWNVGNESSATEYFFASLSCKNERFPLVGIKSGGSEDLVSSSDCGVQADEWLTVISVIENGTAKMYLDGHLIAEGDVDASPADVQNQSLNTIGRAPWPDPLFKGEIASFLVYDRAITDAEAATIGLGNASTALVLDRDALDLGDTTAVTGNLALPTTTERSSDIQWTSSAPDVISTAGVVTRPAAGEDDVEVTLTATLTRGAAVEAKTFTVTVLAELDAQSAAQLDATSVVIPNLDDIRGNITLPTTGPNGSTLTWATSSSAVTTTGEVTRPATGSADLPVELTVTASNDGATATHAYHGTVIAAPDLAPYEGYFFPYFAGESTPTGEQVYFSVSEGNDPLTWTELNDGEPVLVSTEGEQGIRDPFVIRAPEGDRFYMIATDLRIYGGNNFGNAQERGSLHLIVWESNDLVSWSEPRMTRVSADNAGNTWAPEAFYDAVNGEYIVFWASALYPDDLPREDRRISTSYQRMMYSTTRDFVTFTEPQIWIDEPRGSGLGMIDSTIIEHDGTFYRWTKDEAYMLPRQDKTTDLRTADPWELITERVGQGQPNPWGGTFTAGEGPSVIKSNTEDRWYLFIDQPPYHGGGQGYMAFETTDLDSGQWTSITDSALPSGARHGTVLPVTAAEHAAILEAYGDDSSEPTEPTPSVGLVAEYVFDNTTGSEVENSAEGSTLGSATVHNAADSQWTGTSLTLTGGAKNSSGNWVELPDGVLSGATSATVVAEVKADPEILNQFHFLWNIGNESSATEYFFASLNCGQNRNPLVGIKSGGNETLVQSSSCAARPNEWLSVISVIDDGVAKLYLDGHLVAEGPVSASPADVRNQTLNTIGRAPWPDPLFKGEIAVFRVYDQAITDEEAAAISNADALIHPDEIQAAAQRIIDELALSDVTTDSHIDLPTAGGRVAWSSSNPDVVSEDGTVVPPLAGESPVTVVLTASATVRGQVAEQSITVTVTPSTETAEERFERLASRYVVPPVVRSGTSLADVPAGITLDGIAVTGSAEVDGDDVLTVSGDDPATVTLSVQLSGADGLETTRDFTVTVLPDSSAVDLAAYYRNTTSEQEANNADVALSMHLALSDGDGWEPLNENYGIFFALTAQKIGANGPQAHLYRSLKDPHVFYLEDGTYGVVATRTLRGGGQDPEAVNSVLFATSTDLRSYTEIGLVEVGAVGGVNQPQAAYDSASGTYVVQWTSDSGVIQHSHVDLFAGTHGPVERGALSLAGLRTDISGIEHLAAGNVIPVTQEVADALTIRFGRITNTGVTPFDDIEIPVGGAYDLPERAELDYSDGSTGSLVVDWNDDDVAGVDVSTPGTYTVQGTIKQQDYPMPFADERADPSIFAYEWNGQQKFLMIATEDIHGGNINPQGGAHMPIRIADRIDDLSDDALREGRNVEIDLLRRGDLDAYGNAMTGCFWAPELHVIGGKLSVLFMPCYNGSNGQPTMWTGRASIIQLQQDADGNDLDPADPASWSEVEHVLRQDGSDLNQTDPNGAISLDMTYFEDAGTHYYVWQMVGSLFIAEMDPENPTRLLTEPSQILVPEYAWDNLIAEGAHVYARDGKLYMIYSGSLVGNTYTTGLAVAESGADLTLEETWQKLNYPIQKSGIYNGEWQLGTGHGMWSIDEDGNQLYVFHARTDNNNLSGRDMFVRRVHWAADGLPVFDMEKDEEVAPEFRTVSLQIEVLDDSVDPGDPDDGTDDPDDGTDEPGGPDDGDGTDDDGDGTGDGGDSDGTGNSDDDGLASTGPTIFVILASLLLAAGVAFAAFSRRVRTSDSL